MSAMQSSKFKPGRWKRRLRNAAIVLLVLFGIFRISIHFILPSVLERVAGGYGLDCTYERLELSLTGGDAGLWNVVLSPKSGGEPYAKTEYCRADISTLQLLRGRLVIWRLEADGVDLLVDRDEAGKIALLDRFVSTAQATPVKRVATAPMKIDLSAPLRIDALRLQRIHARIRDKSVTPNVETKLELNLRLSNLASASKPTQLLMDVAANPILEGLRIEGEGTSSGKSMDASVRVSGKGLHLKPVAGYLAPLGLKPVADDLAFTMNAKIKTQEEGPNIEGVKGTILLEQVVALADGKESAALDRLAIEVDGAGLDHLHLGNVLIEGVRCRAMRSAEGAMRVAGIELSPGASQSPAAATQQVAVPTSQPAPMMWSLRELNLRAVRASLVDQAVNPVTELAVELPELTAHNFGNGPKQIEKAVDISGRMKLPGIVREITLEGKAQPLAGQKTVDLSLKAAGIKPEALKPYLDAVGLESMLEDGAFTCTVHAKMTPGADGHMRAEARIGGIRFADRKDLLSLEDIRIAGVDVWPDGRRVRVEAIDIAGPRLIGHRDKSGSLAALGFRTKPAAGAGKPSHAAKASSGSGSSGLLPVVEIGRLSWKGIGFHVTDEAVRPAADIKLADAGFEVTNLQINPDPKATVAPATARAWMKAPGLIETLTVEGTVTPNIASPGAELRVGATGITGAAAASYLKLAGLETTLKDGRLRFQTRVKLTLGDGKVGAGLAVEELRFEDGGREWIGLDLARIDGVEVKDGLVTLGDVEVRQARAAVAREKGGSLQFAGLRTLPDVKTSPSSAASGGNAATVLLKKLRVSEAALHISDLSVEPAVSTTATANVELDGMTLGKEGAPGRLNLTAHADGCLDRLSVVGLVSAAPKSQSAKLEIVAEGLRAGPLKSYIPAGLQVDLKDGRFKASVDAGVVTDEKGSVDARLAIHDVEYRDGANGPVLMRLDSAKVTVPQFDPGHRRIAIDEVSLRGFSADLGRNARGQISAFGVTLIPQASKPVRVKAEEPKGWTPPKSSELPLVTLKKLDLQVKHLSFTDGTRAGAAPVVVSNLQVRNRNEIKVLGDEPGGGPAIEIDSECAIKPLADSVKVHLQTAPFAPEPDVSVDVAVSGIRGQSVRTAIPELGSLVDGSELTDGRLTMRIDLAMKLDRRSPVEFDFSRPFGADLTVKQIEFRNGEGPVLGGLDELHCDGVWIDPKGGDVKVKSLDLTKPRLQAYRDAAGVHALGWTIKLPAGGATTKPAKAVAVSAPAEQKPAGEIQIDKFTISGIDVRLEDRTMTPPLIVPLTGLDVEARGLSSLAAFEEKSVRFSVLLNAGKVPLPKKNGGGMEERELFSQVTANGKLVLYPEPSGWVKASVSGFDLASLAGAAKSAGATLNGGIFDISSDIRIKGTGVVDSHHRISFTDLSVTEPADGPIARVLKLPAPLDVVLAALEDQDGAITVPLDVPLRKGRISVGDVVGSAALAFPGVIATAFASSPLKAAGAVGALVGVETKKERPPMEPIAIHFHPAEVSLAQGDLDALAAAAKLLRKEPSLELTLHHSLSREDLERATIRANPMREDCLALVEQLQQSRMELLDARAEAAGQARGELASGLRGDAAQTVEHIRQLDRELGQIEESLDRIFDLLRPGADRQSSRRARAACMLIAQSRLTAVRSALLAGLARGDASRVHLARPSFAPSEQGGDGCVTITATSTRKP